jgi:uncharacterized integral membrane protein
MNVGVETTINTDTIILLALAIALAGALIVVTAMIARKSA